MRLWTWNNTLRMKQYSLSIDQEYILPQKQYILRQCMLDVWKVLFQLLLHCYRRFEQRSRIRWNNVSFMSAWIMQRSHQFPEYANGSPTHWVFFLDVNAVPGHRREKGSMGSGPCFPDISHNVEKRLRIRTLFHVRAFKLIMAERISFPSLFSTPRRFQREKRMRESEKSWRGNT